MVVHSWLASSDAAMELASLPEKSHEHFSQAQIESLERVQSQVYNKFDSLKMSADQLSFYS